MQDTFELKLPVPFLEYHSDTPLVTICDFTLKLIGLVLILSQATLEMKGVKEMKALLDILELDSSVYVRIQVRPRTSCLHKISIASFINPVEDQGNDAPSPPPPPPPHHRRTYT